MVYPGGRHAGVVAPYKAGASCYIVRQCVSMVCAGGAGRRGRRPHRVCTSSDKDARCAPLQGAYHRERTNLAHAKKAEIERGTLATRHRAARTDVLPGEFRAKNMHRTKPQKAHVARHRFAEGRQAAFAYFSLLRKVGRRRQDKKTNFCQGVQPRRRSDRPLI